MAAMDGFEDGAALIVIDVQRGFDDARWGPRNNSGAEGNIARLLARWRAAGWSVVHIRHDSLVEDSPLHPGATGNAIKPEVAPLGGEAVYGKTVNSAFIGTTLEADLRRAGIETLVLTGLTTNHCVSTIARMAGNLGFRTLVVADATATFDRLGIDGAMRPASEVHAAALSDLDGEFATIVTTDALLGG